VSSIVTSNKLNIGLFLDCDGVICELIGESRLRGPRNLAELVVNQSARTLIKDARARGFICIVITNQPDIARGLTTAESIQTVQAAILDDIPELTKFFTCPHVAQDACPCRKPKPALIMEAAAEFLVDLSQSLFIGDRWTDILAAKRSGVRSVLISGWHSWLPSSEGSPPSGLTPDYVYDDLSQVTLEDLK
jgi:D-glycero-D-manno-heptose 1,7-bisphosphate phosphatase